MSPVPFEDTRRLLEAHYALQAGQNPATLTDAEAFRAALTLSLSELGASRDHLQTCVIDVIRETGETGRDRDALAEATDSTTQTWRFVRGQVEQSQLNPDPKQRPSDRSMKARVDLFTRILGTAPTDFARLGPDRKLNLLETAAEVATHEGTIEVFGAATAELIHTRFSEAVAEVRGHRNDVQREVAEDRVAYQNLFAARTRFDQALSAYTLLVQSVLTRAHRLDTLGTYLLAHDAAYQARRAAVRPLKDEANIESVTTPLGTTPDAIEAPV